MMPGLEHAFDLTIHFVTCPRNGNRHGPTVLLAARQHRHLRDEGGAEAPGLQHTSTSSTVTRGGCEEQTCKYCETHHRLACYHG